MANYVRFVARMSENATDLQGDLGAAEHHVHVGATGLGHVLEFVLSR